MDTKPLKFEELDGISAETIAVHHGKLYAGYVAKANAITGELKELQRSGEAAGNATYSQLRALKDAETFAVNGAYLHEWYFDGLRPSSEGRIPNDEAPELTRALEEKWGSLEAGIAYFAECGMAARGWSILCWDVKAGELKHYNADAHNQGGVWGCIPIIVLDVYEHAYFADYGADRKAYIDAFFRNLNWAKAETLYLQARKASL